MEGPLDPFHFGGVPGVLPPNVAVEPILVSLDLAVDGTSYSSKVHPLKVEMSTWKTCRPYTILIP